MKYQIVEEATRKELERRVNALLSADWSLYGSPIIQMCLTVAGDPLTNYAQALTKPA